MIARPVVRSRSRPSRGRSAQWLPFDALERVGERSGLSLPVTLILGVGLGRPVFEMAVAGKPSSYSLGALATSVSFYALAFSLHTLALSSILRVRPERTGAVVGVGLLVGLAPPILDAALGGVTGSGYYYYYSGPLEAWPWLLFDANTASPGESVALWFSIAAATTYVLARSRSILRAVLGFVLAYAATFVCATFPMIALRVSMPALSVGWGGGGAAVREFAVTVTQISMAEIAFLACDLRVLRRVGLRLLHAAPFAALVVLGAQARRLDGTQASVLLGQAAPVVISSVCLLQVATTALVQNDALDRRRGHPVAGIRRAHPQFLLLLSGVLVCGATAVAERWGLVLGLCVLVSLLYHLPSHPGKDVFPINHLLEGAWGWAAFWLGGAAHPKVVGTVSAGFLLLSLLVFVAWTLFSGFKDYKDVRFDAKVGSTTIYTLGYRSRYSLRSVHMGYAILFWCGLALDVVLVATLLRSSLAQVLAGFTAIALGFVVFMKPGKSMVNVFLLGVTAHIGLLAAAISP